jgi:hypothetical protein
MGVVGNWIASKFGEEMIELVRTWQTRESGDHTKVTGGQVWRCTLCNLYFINRSAADEHKCDDNLQRRTDG